MSGETDIRVLLKSMEPVLSREEYVFCVLPAAGSPDGCSGAAGSGDKGGSSAGTGSSGTSGSSGANAIDSSSAGIGVASPVRMEHCWAVIREDEAVTLILEKTRADSHGLPWQSAFRRITLTIHSSLEAVGLTAAVATRLAAHGISSNVVAAFYHDHIFIQSHRADEALACLKELAAENA